MKKSSEIVSLINAWDIQGLLALDRDYMLKALRLLNSGTPPLPDGLWEELETALSNEQGGYPSCPLAIGGDIPMLDYQDRKDLVVQEENGDFAPIDEVAEVLMGWIKEKGINYLAMYEKMGDIGARVLKWAVSNALYSNEKGYGYDDTHIRGVLALYAPLYGGSCPVQQAVAEHYRALNSDTVESNRVCAQLGANPTGVQKERMKMRENNAARRGFSRLRREEVITALTPLILVGKSKKEYTISCKWPEMTITNFYKFFCIAPSPERIAAAILEGNPKYGSFLETEARIADDYTKLFKALANTAAAAAIKEFYSQPVDPDGWL